MYVLIFRVLGAAMLKSLCSIYIYIYIYIYMYTYVGIYLQLCSMAIYLLQKLYIDICFFFIELNIFQKF